MTYRLSLVFLARAHLASGDVYIFSFLAEEELIFVASTSPMPTWKEKSARVGWPQSPMISCMAILCMWQFLAGELDDGQA